MNRRSSTPDDMPDTSLATEIVTDGSEIDDRTQHITDDDAEQTAATIEQ